MREGSKRQEQADHHHPVAIARRAPLARWCVGAVVCWLTFGDYPSQADDFQHELAAARLIETSVLAEKPRDGADLQRLAVIFQRLVTRYPRNPDAHCAFAEYLWNAEAPGAAMGEWQIAESLDPGNAATANHLGGCYLAEGDNRSAVELLARAVQLDSRSAAYHFDLATATFLLRHVVPAGGGGEQDTLNRALAEFKQAADLDPFNAEYAQAYAETFYGMPNPDWSDALKAWAHFLELKGPPDFCYANMARVNLKLGRKEEALGDLDKVTRPDFRKLKEHLLQQARSGDGNAR